MKKEKEKEKKEKITGFCSDAGKMCAKLTCLNFCIQQSVSVTS